MNKENKDNEEIAPSGITRKDAIKKMGKYAALTALGTFMILNPKKAQATSASPSKILRFLIFKFIKILTVNERYINKILILIQLFFNSELRGRALTKIRVHYQHKTLLNYIYIWLKA